MYKLLKWQAPGNGKGFDAKLGVSSKMNNRTIGSMLYIKENSKNSGFVTQEQFVKDIKGYLFFKFGENPNFSLDTHFYKPALFYGFIDRDENYNLHLSIEGNLFINSYTDGDFEQAKKIIINQLDNTSYPNKATTRVKGLKLFPFRILFKLLLENTTLTSTFMKEKLIYIYGLNSLGNYQKSYNIDNINSYKVYDKFTTWVINSLVDLGILDLNKSLYSINKSVLEHIKVLYTNVDYNDMFFESTSCELNQKIANKRVKRDASLILKAKERDNFKCTIDPTHKTFLVNNKSYVEGHHVIPVFQQKNYDFSLDDVDNILSLCPNCHREIHLADNKKNLLDIVYKIQKEYMLIHNIDLIDLYKMYSCIKYNQ